MDLAKKLKVRLRAGDLDLPDRIKRYTSSREEDGDAHMCPCRATIESRTHMAGGGIKRYTSSREEDGDAHMCP